MRPQRIHIPSLTYVILPALLLLGAVGAATDGALAQKAVCGDRLCTEVSGGYRAWEAKWVQDVRDELAAEREKEKAAMEKMEASAMEAATEAPAMEEPAMEMEAPETEMKADATAMEAAPEPAGAMHAHDMQSAEERYRAAPSTMTMLAENVYHYFGGGYSSLVVVSEDDVLITDAANDMRAADLKAEIAKITDVPVTKIALSHEHYDHAGGTGVFEGAEIICHENCQALFDLDPLGIAPEKVDTEFDELLEIDIGGVIVQMHHFAPADGEGTAVFYIPAEKIILTTDLYQPGTLTDGMWMDDSNYMGTREIYRNIEDWDIVHAINAHSPGTDPADMREHIEFVDDLYDAVYAPLSEAAAAGDLVAFYGLITSMPETVRLDKYADWEGYDEHIEKHVQRMILAITHGD